MMQEKLIKRFCQNFQLWQEAATQKLNNMFLAIKFKVRFRYRFCKKYGFVQSERLRKDMVRHYSLLGATFTETRIEKAKNVITGFLLRLETIQILQEKFLRFAKACHELQAAIRRAKSNSAYRYASLVVKFDKEVRYLQWLYEKKLKQNTGKKAKDLNNILNKLANLTNEGFGRPGTSPEGKKHILLYVDRMCAEYLLDYSIWYFVRLTVKMEKLTEEAELKKTNVYQNKQFVDCMKFKKHLFVRLKEHRIRMMKLDNLIFNDTAIVDRDKLYQVDDEAFAREVLGKIPENNDDLASVSELKKLSIIKQKSNKSKKGP